MFPFLFGFSIMHFIENIMKNAMKEKSNTQNSGGYVPVDTATHLNFRPSKEVISLKKRIEGYSNKAYQHPGDPVTVGNGLTYFIDDNGRRYYPVLNRTYADSFLEDQLIRVSADKINRVKSILKKNGLPVPQKIADAIYYLVFNGFTSSREASLLQNGLNDRNKFANWLMTSNGIGPNFLVGSDRRFFVGILYARIRLANFVAGKPIENGINEVTKSMPKLKNGRPDQVTSAEYYKANRLKLPFYF
ncbi:glycoside hydrolase family protein [Bergeyella porcorum]